jgi:gag-polypeptide of LTR copia-type
MNVFQRCSLLNKLAVRRRFYTVSMEEDENMLGYINRVRHIADELKSMDCVVGDEEVVMAILNGLPSEYDHLIVALDAMGGDGETKLRLDVTKSRLLQGERRKNERCGREGVAVMNEQAAALIGNSRRKTVWGPGEVRTENICHRCHKPGHIARNCREKWSSGLGAAHKRDDESANVVDEGAASTNGDEDVCLIGDGNERPRGVQWLIDSGASEHMSASKEAMGNYTTVTPFEVSIGDKTKLRVIGSGHVRLQVGVDGEVKKVTLKNVLHVPKLAYHLVSVSAMESNGMSTNFANGKCKGRICAQATKKGGMYVLDTVSGGVRAAQHVQQM